jgi:hypothetical protein
MEPRRSPQGDYFIWLAPKALKRLDAAQTSCEDYSATILRLAEMETSAANRGD